MPHGAGIFTYDSPWMWPCFPRNVGQCTYLNNPYIRRIWVASKKKESLLVMINPDGSSTAILPMAKCRSKYSHSFNNARDAHPDRQSKCFSTILRESVFIREVCSKQTRKTRVSDTWWHSPMDAMFVLFGTAENPWLKDLTSFWRSCPFSRAFWFVSGVVSPFHVYTSIDQRAKACHDHVMNFDKMFSQNSTWSYASLLH